MAEGQFIAYYRVSTKRQGVSGLGLESQRDDVRAWLNGGNWDLVAEYTEVESGRKSDLDRPQLRQALEHCRRAKAKLVIAKLDRLSRSVAFTSALMESGVEFVAVDTPTATKFTIHILAAVAEHERDRISQRTREALKVAKARGVKLGNPRLAEVRPKAAEALKSQADDFAVVVAPIIREIEGAGITSLRGIARELNTRKIKTRRGREFTPVQVKAIKKRVA